MSAEKEALGRELAELQKAYQEYIAKNGLDYREYLNPPPGSFLEKYKKRKAEIDAVIAPPLQYWKKPA